MAEEYRGEDVLKLLEHLEDMLDDTRQFLSLTWGLDRDAVFTLTSKIRASLPDEVRQARRVHTNQQRIIEDAREEAARIVEDARNQASLLVDQDEIVRQANEQAHALVAQTERDSARIRAEAEMHARDSRRQADDYVRETQREVDEYARNVLDSLSVFVARIQGSIEKGLQKLEEQQTEAAPDPREKDR